MSADAPDPRETLCARLLVRGKYIEGFGPAIKDNLIAVDIYTAPCLERELKDGNVELVIGFPSPPSLEAVKVRPTFPVRDPERVHLWGKHEIRKRVEHIIREKPASFYADRSPMEIAADEVRAEELASVEHLRKERQDAVDRLRRRFGEKADKLRQKAAEANRLAALAEAEAARLPQLAESAPEGDERQILTAKIVKYANEWIDPFTTDPKVVRAESHLRNGKRLWKGPFDFDEARGLVREGLHANGDLATLRAAVERLEALERGPTPDPNAPPEKGNQRAEISGWS